MEKNIILSIDWDFFINATEKERIRLFPCNDMCYNPEDIFDEWGEMYEENEDELYDIDIKEKEYNYYFYRLRDLLIDNPDTKVVIADSHKHIYKHIKKMKKELVNDLSLINIDFHHDCYSSDEIGCESWVYHLIKDQVVSDLVWICDKTSGIDAEIIDEDFEWETSEEMESYLNKIEKSSLIYFCRSSIYSPPHLNGRFDKIVNMIKKYCNNYNVEKDIMIK